MKNVSQIFHLSQKFICTSLSNVIKDSGHVLNKDEYIILQTITVVHFYAYNMKIIPFDSCNHINRVYHWKKSENAILTLRNEKYMLEILTETLIKRLNFFDVRYNWSYNSIKSMINCILHQKNLTNKKVK